MTLTDEEIQQLIQALEAGNSTPQIKRAVFSQLKPVSGVSKGAGLEKLLDIPLKLTAVLGRTRLLVKEVLDLKEDSVIVLNKLVGEPVEILVNGKPLGQGEVVVINETLGVRLNTLAEAPEEGR
ncbi:flagellar motor switch protein FliN/FliY [Thermanaeromonas toyohensis ToBE]|uniref:Flagellar motor switch protein FliN/FliY n=1 Tax=Thermanaeromonas toyohensis ToBE TaxID=698762 RepID=A0A1W1VLV4_9FIRM|nr:flagellar motor switch protein FliN [Thermanaeromonas toyohensis]SMB94031.1 flagellar motor switch protein FliN/FliY [Thermanaeromonas toyohensis ToBE]